MEEVTEEVMEEVTEEVMEEVTEEVMEEVMEEVIDDPRRLTIIVIDKDSYPFHGNISNKHFTKPQKSKSLHYYELNLAVCNVLSSDCNALMRIRFSMGRYQV
jgi:hypothetical protein